MSGYKTLVCVTLLCACAPAQVSSRSSAPEPAASANGVKQESALNADNASPAPAPPTCGCRSRANQPSSPPPHDATSAPSTPSTAAAPSLSTAVPSAPPPWPGVACLDQSAAANLRFFACSNDCNGGDAQGCEALGELHAREEGLPVPASSAGPAAAAFFRACELGLGAACVKRDALLNALTENCRREKKEACVVEGNALLHLPGSGRREQADALYQQACARGYGDGCFQSGELHLGWEPFDEHKAAAERGYQRACALGSASGCCALIAWYEDAGRSKAAAHVRRQARSISGFGCGYGYDH
jgi:hypothetical protein